RPRMSERDIVVRLMDYDKCSDTDIDEAATTIATLRSRVAELEMREDEYKTIVADISNAADAAEARVAELEAIVGRLPLTADGVRVVPGDLPWFEFDGAMRQADDISLDSRSNRDGSFGMAFIVGDDCEWIPLSDCYSTREAAEKARESEAEQ
ncbi:MAG: hypothetical protein P1V36_06635, partial [Planctomycetota bacterium]|nr:hypothetical protein [Planctomycetota bacterium]